MEWVLQVVDEVDDAIGTMRHGWLGLNAEIGALLGAGIAAMTMHHAKIRDSSANALVNDGRGKIL